MDLAPDGRLNAGWQPARNRPLVAEKSAFVSIADPADLGGTIKLAQTEVSPRRIGDLASRCVRHCVTYRD
jgi:hypothetical protein